MESYLELRDKIEIYEATKQDCRKTDRKKSLGMLPEASLTEYGSSPVPHTLNSSRLSGDSTAFDANDPMDENERKKLHRLSFKNLERRNFYSQILAPPDASSTQETTFSMTEDQAVALKRLHDVETYKTSYSKRLKAQKKRMARQKSLAQCGFLQQFQQR